MTASPDLQPEKHTYAAGTAIGGVLYTLYKLHELSSQVRVEKLPGISYTANMGTSIRRSLEGIKLGLHTEAPATIFAILAPFIGLVIGTAIDYYISRRHKRQKTPEIQQ